MHEDNEKCYSSDKRDADEVQADSQPAHSATKEVVGGLVGVQQFLISKKRKERDTVNPFQAGLYTAPVHWKFSSTRSDLFTG